MQERGMAEVECGTAVSAATVEFETVAVEERSTVPKAA